MKRKRSACIYSLNPADRPRKFCKIFQRLSNGYNISSEFIGFFRRTHFSSEYSDGLIFPRNSVGIFRRTSEETQFCVSSECPRKLLGIFRGFHFPSECPSEYRCFFVVCI
ncbi:unnamed protein product [Brassica oleracea var. botrytis]